MMNRAKRQRKVGSSFGKVKKVKTSGPGSQAYIEGGVKKVRKLDPPGPKQSAPVAHEYIEPQPKSNFTRRERKLMRAKLKKEGGH